MSVFGAYARYYDLLYQDKDYEGEVRYVGSLIDRHLNNGLNLLDIGCGTGRHADLFSRRGMKVSGIDRSEDMIRAARKSYPEINFQQGDFSTFGLDQKFDVITALFHVVSYINSDQELVSAFSNVSRHLKPGGLFIFDCWHGPAVLHHKPELRVKRLQDDAFRVVRIAEPDLIEAENRVDVNYQVFVGDEGGWDEFSESHSMRYLFANEIESFLDRAGMHLIHTEEWMTSRAPSRDSWGVVYVAEMT